MTLTRDQAEEWARRVADALEVLMNAWAMPLDDKTRSDYIRIARKLFEGAIADVMLSAGNQ